MSLAPSRGVFGSVDPGGEVVEGGIVPDGAVDPGLDNALSGGKGVGDEDREDADECPSMVRRSWESDMVCDIEVGWAPATDSPGLAVWCGVEETFESIGQFFGY